MDIMGNTAEVIERITTEREEFKRKYELTSNYAVYLEEQLKLAHTKIAMLEGLVEELKRQE